MRFLYVLAVFMRPLRRLCASALLLCFGTVSLVGHGLHLLPGLAHHHPGQACGGHCHVGHCHCEHEEADAESEFVSHEDCDSAAPGLGSCDHGCAVCAFMAQGQSCSQYVELPLSKEGVFAHEAPHCLRLAASLCAAYSPRAPPQLGAI